MFGLLPWVPVATSLTLGIVYLAVGDASLVRKFTVTGVFLAAVYLQFLTLHGIAGMLLQIALALGLALWRKANAA